MRYNRSEVFSLDGITFPIFTGEKIGIFGPNGAGKTTLISLICGLFSPTTGTIHFQINGKQLSNKEIRHQIGYVPQEYAFFQELTPEQNLLYFGALYDIPKRELKEKITSLLTILGLQHVAKKKVSTFSGGMKRRVNLAIGMINNPSILFLDEPTVGVDVQSKTAIMSYLEELNQQGTTIVYTSHHLQEAEEFCSRIVLLDHGKLLVIGEIQEVFAQHEVNDLNSFFLKLTGTQYRD